MAEDELVAAEDDGGDLVALEDASDADLEEYLNKPDPGEEEPPAPEEPQPAPERKPRKRIVERSEIALAGEKPKEAPKPYPAESAPPQVQQALQAPAPQAPQPEQPQQPTDQVSQEQYQRLLGQLKQKELFIQRRNSELGDLRKQLREANTKLQEGLNERFQEAPAEAMRDFATIRENEQRIKKLEAQEKSGQTELQAQKLFFSHIKPDEVSVDDMARSLADDGVDQRFISSFKANPWASASPLELIHLAKRARVEKLLAKTLLFAKKVMDENAALKAKPEQVIQGVQKALRTPPQVQAASGGAASDAEPEVPADLSSWSEAQLNEFLARSK